jgi:hypothetical protein
MLFYSYFKTLVGKEVSCWMPAIRSEAGVAVHHHQSAHASLEGVRSIKPTS